MWAIMALTCRAITMPIEYEFGVDTNLADTGCFPTSIPSASYNTYGKSNYNSLQAEVERRFTNGLQVTGSFTWEKETDDSCGAYDCQQPQDFRNLKLEEGLSNLDQPYRLVFSALYELPFGRGKHWGSDWSRPLEMRSAAGSSTASTLCSRACRLTSAKVGGAQGTIRPDIVAKTSVKPGNITDYFNTAAFTAVARYFVHGWN